MANQSITGKVAYRRLDDLSIAIVLKKSYAVINLALWQEAQTCRDKNQLPHTNNALKINNIKFIAEEYRNEICIHYYLAVSTTTISVFMDNHEETDNSADDFVSVAEMSNILTDQDLLTLINMYHLTEEHLELYIRLCIMLPYSSKTMFEWNHSTFALFRILVEEKIVNKFSINPCGSIQINKRNYIVHTAKTVKRISELVNVKEQWDNQCDIVPYFGNKQSKTNECLIGILTCYKGKVLIEDGITSISLHINSPNNMDLIKFCNRLVLILEYHSIYEIYYDGCTECLCVDIKNIRLLCNFEIGKSVFSGVKYNQPALVSSSDEIRCDCTNYYQYSFKVKAISSICKVYQCDEIEVWLLIEITKEDAHSNETMGNAPEMCLLSLSEAYLSVVPLLDVGRTYILFTPSQLEAAAYNPHIVRFSEKLKCFKLTSPGSYFLPTESFNSMKVVTSTANLPTNTHSTLNIRVRLLQHFLNPTDTHRKVPECSHALGMLASKFDHKLVLLFNNNVQKSIYLSHWEEKQTPEGLHPNAILLITQATYNGRYFSTNIFTEIKVIGVGDELNEYATANFNVDSTELTEYDSITKETILNIKYFTFIRTKVYVVNVIGTANFALKKIDFSFKVLDNSGCIELQCTKYPLLYKFLEIDEIEDYEHHTMYQKDISFSTIDEIEDMKCKAPFFYIWLQHIYYKLNYGMISMDVLCKKTLKGIWTIQDVFKVNY